MSHMRRFGRMQLGNITIFGVGWAFFGVACEPTHSGLHIIIRLDEFVANVNLFCDHVCANSWNQFRCVSSFQHTYTFDANVCRFHFSVISDNFCQTGRIDTTHVQMGGACASIHARNIHYLSAGAIRGWLDRGHNGTCGRKCRNN